MKLSEITLQCCMEKLEKEGKVAIINDGKIIKFKKENGSAHRPKVLQNRKAHVNAISMPILS